MNSRPTVLLLAACQATFVTGTSLIVAVSALVGVSLAPDPRLATLPAGVLALFAMATTMPASLLMRRIGRQNGFRLGVVAGAIGASTSALAIARHDFALFCAGAAGLGVLAGAAGFYRFAAADAVSAVDRPRAISLVLAGGLVAAFLGPSLAAWSRTAVAGLDFVGCYIALALLQIVSLTLLGFVDIPRPPLEETAGGGRPLTALVRQPRYAIAVFAAVVAYATMTALMSATPLAMGARGFAFGDTATVIQWHAVGMFAPSFFSGRLVQRYGTLPMMAAGCLCLVLSAAAGLAGESAWFFRLGLAALGVGWNFLFVAASTLLTRTYSPGEKARAQGLNDLLVFATVTVAAGFSGVLHEVIGWRVMNLASLVPVVALLLLTTVAHQRNRASSSNEPGGAEPEGQQPTD